MPWTASARRQYARPAARYATDLTDAEFALLAPHLPTPSRVGRPREVDLREVLDAILYLLRTGCPWRLLPKSFPPESTVLGYFRHLWEDGTWPTLHALLVMAAREQAGREASPTAGIIDGQSVRILRGIAVLLGGRSHTSGWTTSLGAAQRPTSPAECNGTITSRT